MVTVEKIKQKLVPILRQHGIRRAGLFGSAARREMTSGSDIDILVRLGRGASLFDLVGLKLEIEKALGRQVDLVEYESIKPSLRGRILGEEVSII